ncbi:MAG: phosphoglycerate kinase [Patescibacteria group bacterium]
MNVLIRADLEWVGENCQRKQATKNIIEFWRGKGAQRIKVIGHNGNIDQVSELGVDLNFNLRSDPREETNDKSLAEELALGFDAYINEAFATSHRQHCSIDALPRLMRSQGKQVGMGLRFEKEIETLTKVTSNKVTSDKVVIIGGAKSLDKEKHAQDLEKKGWTVLRGGLLPGVDLRPDGFDVSDETITKCKILIANSSTIVVAGPMGKYEEAPEGTQKIFTAVANSKAYKVAGGGDTEAALEKFGLKEKFDWISVGGGAMLEYLSSGTLPGLEALV